MAAHEVHQYKAITPTTLWSGACLSGMVETSNYIKVKIQYISLNRSHIKILLFL